MKAAIYARYSSDNQREESIDAQIRAIKEYAERSSIAIVKVYTDEARSATTADRPGFLQMVKDSSLGLFDSVIVHKLDRFSRDRYDSAFYKRQLKRNGVKLISVLEQLDDSPESIILESVLEGMAEYYSANLAREVMKGMRETALQCKHAGGRPPLGYDVAEDKTYVINEREAQIVKLIFKLYSQGHGYKKIIGELKRLGYKTQKGNDFTQSSVHDLLKNEKYMGVYVFNRTASKEGGKRNHRKNKCEDEIIRILGGMPAIVEEHTFNLVRERMSKQKMNAQNRAKEVYLLSGRIYCGQCGAMMIGHTSRAGRNKKRYSNYYCGTRYRTKNCDLKPVNRDFVEELVVSELRERIFNPASIQILKKKLVAQYQKAQKEDREDLKLFRERLKDVQSKITNIVNAIAAGMFHPSMKEKMDVLEDEKAKIVTSITELESKEILTLDEVMIEKYLLKEMYALEGKEPEDLKRIIETYVDKVIVFQDHIDVHLKIIVHNGGGGGPYRIVCTISISDYRHNKTS